MTSPDKAEMWVALILFIFSELVGVSKLKENSLLQLVLAVLYKLFPAQVKIKKPRNLK